MAKSLDDLQVLQKAEEIADRIWELVLHWSSFEKQTVGKQIARAADSVGANIAEAFGRYHYGEKLKFLYYARGSLFETKYWIKRASKRGLLPVEDFHNIAQDLSNLARQINAFAKFIKIQRASVKTVKESLADYVSEDIQTDYPSEEVFSKAGLKSLAEINNN